MAKKKQVKNKNPSKKWTKFKLLDGKVTRARNCPKCGPGIFFAEHKDRLYCGHCHYLEVKK